MILNIDDRKTFPKNGEHIFIEAPGKNTWEAHGYYAALFYHCEHLIEKNKKVIYLLKISGTNKILDIDLFDGCRWVDAEEIFPWKEKTQLTENNSIIERLRNEQ